MLPAILGVAQAGLGIAGSMAGHANQVAQAKARNEAMMKEYEYRLQIRDKKWKDELQIYANKLGQYDLQMKAADAAAVRAYGVESYKQSQRVKQAGFASFKLTQALAKGQGRAAAAGKTGRSAQRLDREVENAFVAQQNMIDLNLFDQEASSRMNSLNIRDQLASARNQAYSQVAIAPTTPMELLEPTQVEAPPATGAMIGAASSALGAVGGFMNNMAPDPGNIGGGLPGGGSSFMPFGSSLGSYTSPTPLTSGMNFFQ